MSKPLIQEIHYLRIPVQKLEAAVAWYQRCLGFEPAWSRDDMAMVKVASGQLLILMKADPGAQSHFPVAGKPVETITFTSPEIRQLHLHLKTQGVRVEEISEDNGHLLFHFYDLDGNKFQVHW